MQARFDRHVRLATAIAGEPPDVVLRKFVGQQVLLTGDPRRLSSPSGRIMLLTAANMIARFCPRIHVAIPEPLSGLATEAVTLMRAIDSTPRAEFAVIQNPDYSSYAAVLSVGATGRRASSTIEIDGAGWLAAVSTDVELPRLPASLDDNPFGPLMAAALGAAEVFKRLLEIRPEKGAHFGDIVFSTYDYSMNPTDPGPSLPPRIDIPLTLLAGVGAVGNAFLLALSHVPDLRGEIIAVDRQAVDDTNLNRYLLAIEDDAAPAHPLPKTELATRLFANRHVKIHPYQEPLEDFLSRLYRRELQRPDVVVSAVDNNEARKQLQFLWPTILLEGATDAAVSQVSRHEYAQGLGCLMCIHSVSQDDAAFSYVDHAAQLSSLSRERIEASMRDESLVLAEDDIRDADTEKRAVLAKSIGKTICSVLADLERLSRRAPEELPVQPAVSFVSMISGLLAAGELVKYAARLGSPLETFFHMDSMYPLSNAFLQAVEKVGTCYCATRKAEIQRYRDLHERG